MTFADRPSHDAWGRHPEHREAQRAGVSDYYEEYSISVGDGRPRQRLVADACSGQEPRYSWTTSQPTYWSCGSSVVTHSASVVARSAVDEVGLVVVVDQ